MSKKIREMSDEEFKKTIANTINHSQEFTLKVNSLRKEMNISVLELCLHTAISAESCMAAYPEEWTAVNNFLKLARANHGTK